jgi:hypothetical protein
LEPNRHSTARLGKSVLAGLLAAFILLVNTFACDSAFHKHLHADPGHSGHNCALCLFLHGQVDSADVAIIKDFFVASMTACQPATDTFGNSSLDLRLSPSRAPPSC